MTILKQIFKKKDTTPYDRPARPWDLFNKELGRVETEVAAERMEICKACPFLQAAGTCSECGCFMAAKTKLPNAFCPKDKWGAVSMPYKEIK